MTGVSGVVMTSQSSADAILSQTAAAKLQRPDDVMLCGRNDGYWHLRGLLEFYGLMECPQSARLLEILRNRAEASTFERATFLERISPIVGQRAVRVVGTVPPPDPPP